MRKTLALIGFLLAFSTSNANAFFFFFLPGSVTGKIADAFTGAEGDNCVGANVKVGDTIRLQNGSLTTVKSLPGTSSRCTNAETPIRALLGPSSQTSAQNATQARIDLPEGWKPTPLTEAQRNDGAVLLAYNGSINTWFQVSTATRSKASDLAASIKSMKDAQLTRLKDPEATQTETTQLAIGNLPAWRFELGAKVNGIPYSIMKTVLEGRDEIVVIECWTTTANFSQVKEGLAKIVESVTGITPPARVVKEVELKKKIAEDEIPNVGAGQIDFNAEANKAARILGCQATDSKVLGIVGANIQYAIHCDDGKTLNLSCDQSGLCLQQKQKLTSPLTEYQH